MTILLIASTKDPASINIKKCLLNNSKWNNLGFFYENIVYENKNNRELILITINDKKIFHDNIDIEVKKKLGLKPKLAIFISRHSSKSGNPTLTVHPIGNFGKALFGGEDKKLMKTSPLIMTRLLRILKFNANKNNLYHNVCFEVTHHGPKISIPSLFIEVGSNITEWNKKLPASIVANTLIDYFNMEKIENDSSNIPILIGIGGGHYAPRFTDVALERRVAFGHMIPTYQINSGNIDNNIIKNAIETTPNFRGMYIHKKALKKSQVTELRNMFINNDIKVFSSKEFEKIN